MALIKCPECKKEISDKAPACIHCGYPMNDAAILDRKTEIEKKKTTPSNSAICPWCGNKVFSELISCSKCGCPADVIKRSQRLNNNMVKDSQKIEYVKACAQCGHIIWQKDFKHYKENYCIECRALQLSHSVKETPVTCCSFNKKLHVKKNESVDEKKKYRISLCLAQKEVFEKHVQYWTSLDKTRVSYKSNIRYLYNNNDLDSTKDEKNVFDNITFKTTNEVKKSKISSWWIPIFFFSGFFTICNGGPVTNLILWPILLLYVHFNARQVGYYDDEDIILTIGGCIIWIVNLIVAIAV